MVRIRKNLKLSSLQFFPNVAQQNLQPHFCQLNHSPWDYSISSPFDLLDSLSSPPPLLQFQVGEGYIGNGSLTEDSYSAVESVLQKRYGLTSKRGVALPMDVDKLVEVVVVVAGDVSGNSDKEFVRCQRTDGKTWQCKKEAKEGYPFCDHHLTRKPSTTTNPPSNFAVPRKTIKTAPAKTPAGPRRGRPKLTEKGKKSGNPYEFYYSGFRPKWSRKKRKKGQLKEDEEDNNNNVEAVADNVAAASNSTSTISHANTDNAQHCSQKNVTNGAQLDYMEEDFDDEDGSDGGGGPRRPVKARSLMSIINVRAQEK